MRFAFTEEQQTLQEVAREFLSEFSNTEAVRKIMETDAGWDLAVWDRMTEEQGWQALVIPEEYEGWGFGPLELAAVMEEMGRAMFTSPFFATVCLAAQALIETGTETQKATWLPQIAAGSLRATLAFCEPGGGWRFDDIAATATQNGDGWVLNGTKAYVLDGHTAGLILIAARDPGTTGEQGLRLYLVDAQAEGLEIEAEQTLDQTRRMATLRLHDVEVDAHSQSAGGATEIERGLDRARVALAAEQVGGAEATLDMAVDYAKVRKQFGRPIGSFQAIKHKCADMLMWVESARSAALYAAWASANEPGSLTEAAAVAQATCADALFRCAGENIQIHGGIGFTWEHDAHLYFKRARASKTLLGTPRDCGERLLQVLERG